MRLPAELISLDSSLRTNLKQYIWVSSEVVNKIAVPQGDQQKLKIRKMAQKWEKLEKITC